MKLKSRTGMLSGNSVISGTVIGVILALLISLLLMTGMTSFAVNGSISEKGAGVSMCLIRTIAVLAGVLVGTGIIKEKCVITAGAITLGYLLLLAGVGIVLYDESFKDFGLSAIFASLGGTIGCLFRLKLQNKPLGKKKIRL